VLISSVEQLQSVVAELAIKPAVAMDLETTGLQPAEGSQIVVASLHHPDVGTFCVPFRAAGFITNLPEEAVKRFQTLVDNTEIVGHNFGSFDMNFLRAEGVDVSSIRIWDTLLQTLLWNDSLPRFGLRRIMSDQFGVKEAEDLMFPITDVYKVPLDVLIPRAETDAVLTWNLRQYIEPKILERGDPYPELVARDNQWAKFLGDLGWAGIAFDEHSAETLIQRYRRDAFDIEQAIWERWKPGLKLNSPTQLLKFFQGKHGVTLPDTEDWVLRMAAKEKPSMHNDVEAVLEWRRLDKAIRTWMVPWLKSSRQGNGRVRGGWGLDASNEKGKASGITRTLRLRCSKPNLQAVPTVDDRYQLRYLFKADGRNELVGYDQSQMEVRMAAHYANEVRMLEELRKPKGDVHQMVADDVKLDRYVAKRINLGTIYRIGRSHLAEVLTKERLEIVAESETERWLSAYRRRYPGLVTVARRAEAVIQRRGYLRLWNGRRVHFNPDLDDPYKALNLLIQTGVSEILKSSVFTLQDFVKERGLRTKIVLCVYDEIITETPPEELEYIPDIKRRLESIGDWRCPLKVETWHRERWSNRIPKELE